MLTGDAAGFADPVTAEGISNAVLSGKLAAEAVIKSGGNPAETSILYNTSLRQTILKELNYSQMISPLVYGYPSARSILFRLYGQKLSELITDIFTGDKKYSSLLNDPLNYLKLFKYLVVGKNSGRVALSKGTK